jgi:hypothetical protein
MKLVNESLLEFEQGGNPYDTMGLGLPKVGDKYMCLHAVPNNISFRKNWIYTLCKIEKDEIGNYGNFYWMQSYLITTSPTIAYIDDIRQYFRRV